MTTQPKPRARKLTPAQRRLLDGLCRLSRRTVHCSYVGRRQDKPARALVELGLIVEVEPHGYRATEAGRDWQLSGRKGSMSAPSTGAADVAGRPRQPTKNTSDPRGQFGAFLRAWIDKHCDGKDSVIAGDLGMTARAIRKWCEGAAGPAFQDLDRVAAALGYSDWAALAAAVKRFHSGK